MKLLIIPILKFVWAILLTIGHTLTIIVGFPLSVIWHFNFDYDWEYRLNTRLSFGESPYYDRNPNFFGLITFKTYYHYIWGIESKRRYE